MEKASAGVLDASGVLLNLRKILLTTAASRQGLLLCILPRTWCPDTPRRFGRQHCLALACLIHILPKSGTFNQKAVLETSEASIGF